MNIKSDAALNNGTQRQFMRNPIKGRPKYSESKPRPFINPAVAHKIIMARPAPANLYVPKFNTKPLVSAGDSENTIVGPASIAELARALNNDADEIYAYVHDNIEFNAVQGLHSGAWATAIAGFGGAWDQSDLMVQLLRAAGYTANYVYGTAQLTLAQMTAWMGTTDWNAAGWVLSNGGINASLYTDGTTEYVQFSHCWVQVEISGTQYIFDPTITAYSTKNSIDLSTALGYTQSAFTTSVETGATVTPDYVQNLNTANLQADLTSYSVNLKSWIENNNSGAGIDDILGGRSIVPTTGTTRNTSLAYELPGETPTVWTSIPSAYQTTVQVEVDTINVTFNSSDICGRRLSLFYNASNEIELCLEGTVVGTTSAFASGTYPLVSINVNLPFWESPESWEFEFGLYNPGFAVIGHHWGTTGRGIIDYRKQQLAQAIFSGTPATSEAVLGEQLYITFLEQYLTCMKSFDLYNRMNGSATAFNFELGLISYYTGGTVLMNLGTLDWSTTSLTDDSGATYAITLPQMMSGFCAEGLSIAQTFGIPGASAETAIDSGNSQGLRTYLATSSNWTSTVEPNLSGYSSDDISNIQSYIDNGQPVLLPSQANIPLAGSALQMTGYVVLDATADGGGSGVIEGLFGGAGGALINPPLPGGLPGGGKPNGGPTSDEPIILSNGNYSYDKDDLSIGSTDAPYKLTFTRSYNSANRLVDSGLGLGWMHSFQMSVVVGSDSSVGMGENNAMDAVGAIAALYVANDILAGTTGPEVDKYTIALMVLAWWTEQMTNNTLTMTSSEGSVVFSKLPDGSFSTPSYISGKLVLNADGTYTFKNPQQVALNFNNSGLIATKVYPYGVTWTFNYSGNELSSVTNGLGRTLSFAYTSGGKLSSVSDGTGRSVSFTIDSNNDLVSFVDAMSAETTYSYDLPGRMTEIFLPANPTTAFVTNTYDSLGRVETQANALGQVWTYFFAGTRSQENDPLGNKKVWYFNKYGLATRFIDALGNETISAYDGRGRLIQRTAPEGNYIQNAYDSNDNVLSLTTVAKPGSGLANLVQNYTYHSTYNKVLTAEDARGNTTTMTYDATTGNLLTVKRPVVSGSTPTVTLTYNARGQVLTKTDETGIITQWNYDTSTEKLNSIIHDYGSSPHLNLTTQFGYDTVGNINFVIDPNSNETNYVFDANRRKTQKTDPAPFSYVTNYAYDLNNNLTSVERQTGGTPAWQTYTIAYTLSDKRKTITDPLSYVKTFTYDTKDRLWKVTDAQSRTTIYAYDALDRISTVTDPSSTIADTRTYTVNGYLYQRSDARSKMTTYSYDGFDRLNTTTYADASYEQNSSYDANGNILVQRTRSGNTITCTYDVLNRLSTKAPTSEATVTYGYDLAGRLTSIGKPVVSGDPSTGNFLLAFDTAGRYYQETTPDSKVIAYGLDANGNKVKLTYPDGYYISQVYDQLNRLTDIKLNGATASAAHFVYDELSRRTQLTLGNGAVVNYGYQLNDDMTSLGQVFNSTTSVTFTHGYNDVHQETSVGVTDGTYLWHPAATATTTYGTATSVNEYPTVGSATYTYDSNANLKSDGTWTYTYDTENHLTQAVKTGTTVSFLIDPLHRQAQKTVGTTKTRFIYGRQHEIADYNGTSGALNNRYVFGPGFDEPLIVVTSAGVVSYMHADRRGSIIATTSAAGAVTNKYKYSPYGESATLTGTTFGYTGQRYDAETGLTYYKRRYYSPTLGRFLQPEPLKYIDSLNLYAYVINDPLNRLDPNGRFMQVIGHNPGVDGPPNGGEGQPSGPITKPGGGGLSTSDGNTAPKPGDPNFIGPVNTGNKGNQSNPGTPGGGDDDGNNDGEKSDDDPTKKYDWDDPKNPINDPSDPRYVPPEFRSRDPNMKDGPNPGGAPNTDPPDYEQALRLNKKFYL